MRLRLLSPAASLFKCLIKNNLQKEVKSRMETAAFPFLHSSEIYWRNINLHTISQSNLIVVYNVLIMESISLLL